MTDKKIPFGFRQDVEPEKPQEKDISENEREINVTSCSTERRWSATIFPVAQAECKHGSPLQ